MPLYEYRCPADCGRVTLDLPVDLRNSPPPCGCGSERVRVWSMPAVKLRGPGFYTTDVGNLDKQKAQGRRKVREGEIRPQSDLTRFE